MVEPSGALQSVFDRAVNLCQVIQARICYS